MTGEYTCEVSTEGIFETRQKSAKMTVIGKGAYTHAVSTFRRMHFEF